MLQIWQSTPIGRRILLDPSEDPALQPSEVLERHKALLGKTGTAKSLMMPSGMIEIDGERYDAVSAGMPIDPGTPIVVVHVDGINLTVRPVISVSRPIIPSALKTEARPEPEVEDPFVLNHCFSTFLLLWYPTCNSCEYPVWRVAFFTFQRHSFSRTTCRKTRGTSRTSCSSMLMT
jgi:hypothetical protein